MKNDQLLKSKVTEANVLLSNKDLEGVGKLLKEIDFMLGKNDEYISQLAEIFTKMVDFDFSNRLPICETDEDGVSALLSRGLNWLNEEFEAAVIHKEMISIVFDIVNSPDSLLIITDIEGNIKVVSTGSTDLPGFTEDALAGKAIHTIFENFNYVDTRIKKGDSTRSIPILFNWLGHSIPSSVHIGFSSRLGKLGSGIYYIKLAPDWRTQLNS
ncbi:MAG: hypothetical protein H7259_02650 [Cytophagales bacterium]|nr:hypothetical protein [Cytophaga sp.]